MAKSRSELKILLLQIRDDGVTLEEEVQEFVRFSGLRRDQIDTLNTFQNLDFTPEVMDGYDGLFVGGSSDASVLDIANYPFVENSKVLLGHCYDNDIPVFASCFGFQIAVVQFGGEVIVDKANMEMGIHPVQLQDAAKDDALFRDTPQGFWVVSGHKERALTMPNDAIVLASTEKCPYHAFKMKGKPFYGFQFHPEVDRHDLVARITRYQERYLDGDDSLQAVLETAIHETTESTALVKKFVDRIMLGSQ